MYMIQTSICGNTQRHEFAFRTNLNTLIRVSVRRNYGRPGVLSIVGAS